MFLGLRTIIYPTADLTASKVWYTELLGFPPYFDEEFFVGFTVGGYELALDPNAPVDAGPRTYWGVPDCEAALARLLAQGARPHENLQDVGHGIRVAGVLDPEGSVMGIIENPNFALPDGPASPGPGR